MFKKTWKHTSETTSKSFKNNARRPPETASEKHPPKNNTKIEKYRKCMILGCPKNREATKNGRTFHHFFGCGRLWDTSGAPPGAKMVPRPPPRVSGTPLGVNFTRLLCYFCSFFLYFLSFCGFGFGKTSTRKNKACRRHTSENNITLLQQYCDVNHRYQTWRHSDRFFSGYGRSSF